MRYAEKAIKGDELRCDCVDTSRSVQYHVIGILEIFNVLALVSVFIYLISYLLFMICVSFKQPALHTFGKHNIQYNI